MSLERAIAHCREVAEDFSFASVCRWKEGHHAPPDIVVCPTSCNTYLKWVEIWQEYFHVPVVVLDQPTRIVDTASYWGSPIFEEDKRYMLSQLRDLVEVCQRVSGKPFHEGEGKNNPEGLMPLWTPHRATPPGMDSTSAFPGEREGKHSEGAPPNRRSL